MTARVLNLKTEKRKKVLGLKEFIVIVISVVLTTLGIKASDTLWNSDNGQQDGPCSQEMVFIPSPNGGFCIDKYESSPGENCPHANPQNQLDSRTNIDYRDCKPVAISGKNPWRFISQSQAVAACSRVGKRLPTGKEWQLAAMGTPDIAGQKTKDDCNVSKNWEAQPGLTGSGKNCVSSFGIYDMVGNLWEWVDGGINDGKYKDTVLPENGYIKAVDDEAMPSATDKNTPDENYYKDYFWIKEKGVRSIARGGYWDNGDDAGVYAVYAVTDSSFAGTGIGFRCVK